MHISLDSALGRQKRLNSVGESVLQIAPDAAAAYSLRSLTGGDPDVVRVRRESDNTEKDFSGSQIESGEMARWVNEQPTLPLDLRELDTNTGERDGALIEAAAAYSLRKLKEDFTGDVVEVRRNVDGATKSFTAAEVTDGTLEDFVNASFDDELPLDQATGAAAAYSLRNLSSSYTGNVVEVRRSSDDAVQSFTASEVADGTLEDWVNTDIDKLDLQAESGGLVGNVSNETANSFDFSVNNEGSNGFKNLLSSSNTSAGTYEISFYADLNGGSLTGCNVYYNDTSGSPVNTAITEGANFLSVTPQVGTSIFFYVLGTAVADVSITNITLTQTTADGHVKTWYDQSGSDNHAVQTDTAKQPKIVEGGVLVSDGIKFDGVDDHLDIASGVFSVANSADKTLIVVSKSDATGAGIRRQLFLGAGNGTRISLWKTSDTSNVVSFNGFANGVTNTFDNTNTFLAYAEDLSGTQNFYINGGNLQTNALGGTNNDVNTAEISNDINAQHWSGIQSEIILYNSDQSDKRRAIEENIANHYGISLAAFSRDGTVSTWYDQSGNTNHATQTDPTKQPKIVEGGSLVTGGLDFDGSQFLGANGIASSVTGTDQPYSTFSVSKTNTTATQYLLGMGRAATSTPIKNILYHSGGNFGIQQRDDANTLKQNLSVSAYSTGTTYLTSTTSSGTVIDFSKNGSLDLDDFDVDVGLLTIDKVNIGARANSDANPLNGSISELIIYNSDQSDNRTAIEANIGETYGITDIPAANDTVNGFVQAWYDQSGSGNDAEQTTAANQPKIVGEVTSGQPHAFLGAIEFENGLYVEKTGLSLSGPFSTFSLSNANSQHSGALLKFGTGFSQQYRGDYSLLLQYGDLNFSSANVYTIGEQNVMSFIFDTTGLGYYNGTEVINDATTGATATQFRVGNSSFGLDGDVKEVIIYNSNQSANRPAIEANIANQYGITLS